MRILLLLILLMLNAACEQAADPVARESTGVRVEQRMGAAPDPGFARAIEPREFTFPDDHGAHPDFATEWWYFTGNLRHEDDRRFGYQLTLFRVGLKSAEPPDDSNWRANQLYMGHLAISDIEDRRHHAAERFSRAAAGLAGTGRRPVDVWLGPWSIRSRGATPFPLTLSASTEEFAIELTLEAGRKPVVLQGEQGLSRKSATPGNASYYYSHTRLPTRGEIRIGEQRFAVAGDSWFDREWSSSALAPDQAGWDWFALHLDDDRDLMFYRMRGKQGHAQRFSSGVLVDRTGRTSRLSLDQVELQPTRFWKNAQGTPYPVAWRVKIPQYDLDLSVEALLDDQEMQMTVRYWEGAVEVSGSANGVGYLELSGYARE